MALSRRALSDYDSSLSQVEKAAADYVRRRVDAYLASYPGASVADVREFAVEVVSDAVSVYGDAASTAAADLYDELAVASPEPLPTAAVDTSDVSGYMDKEVRYQAGKLVDGAPSAFAEAVAACAGDQVSRRANATMAGNAQRDHIRYARVPMGGETCTFCAMLASRGFVYRSAKSAGEGTHWHKELPLQGGPRDRRGGGGIRPGRLVRALAGDARQRCRPGHVRRGGACGEGGHRRAFRAQQSPNAITGPSRILPPLSQ